jgi:hypothetical protein
MAKIRTGWMPNMEQRAKPEDRQVKCLIASGGHLWMEDFFDRLPAAVRHRLADGRYNICPACFTEEAERTAATQGLRRPTIAIYIATLKAIERKLDASHSTIP